MYTTRTAPPTSAQPSLVRRQIITAAALTAVGIGSRPSASIAHPSAEILSAEEAIHQERVFNAGRQRVYEALTIEAQFDKVIQLSGVLKDPAMAKKQAPTKLSPNPGGAFALFGGYIVGRQIELVPNELVIQAWRVQGWAGGTYSIARFELTDQGESTKLLFDHKAFPKGAAEHLASGWEENYWDPLAKFLA
jgi:activator of HSP90 ATPase